MVCASINVILAVALSLSLWKDKRKQSFWFLKKIECNHFVPFVGGISAEMKGVKGKLLKTIKSIKPITRLKQDGILRPFSPSIKDPDEEESTPGLEPDVIDVSELIRDLPDESMEARHREDDKENNGLQALKQRFQLNTISEVDEDGETPLSEIDISSFRRPEINAGSLFDPKLLAAFQQAVKDCIRMNEEERKWAMREENLNKNEEDEPPLKSRRIESEKENPLLVFPEKCPPGGSSSVILYTTSLRGIRKTFEDCDTIRIVLESFKVAFFERDVSIHRKFKEELWQTLGGKFLPPKLFINGRFIGGAEEVLNLHEQGKLKPLFQCLPMDVSNGHCDGCGGIRFVVCFSCHGSHKRTSMDGKASMECPDCNENGLILCPCC